MLQTPKYQKGFKSFDLIKHFSPSNLFKPLLKKAN
jgi:hypothetical protein